MFVEMPQIECKLAAACQALIATLEYAMGLPELSWRDSVVHSNACAEIDRAGDAFFYALFLRQAAINAFRSKN